MKGTLTSYILIASVSLLYTLSCNGYYLYTCPDDTIHHYNGKKAVLGQPDQHIYFPNGDGVVLNSSVPATEIKILCVNQTNQDVSKTVRCTKDVQDVPQWTFNDDYQILKQGGYFMLVVMNPEKFMVTYTWWMYGSGAEVTSTSIQNIASQSATLVITERPEDFGDKAVLQCQVSHPIRGQLLWTLDGKQLDVSVNGSNEDLIAGPKNTLQINDFQRKHQGSYACIIEENCFDIGSKSKRVTAASMDGMEPTQGYSAPAYSTGDGGNDTALTIAVVCFIVLICLASIVPIYKCCQQRRRKQEAEKREPGKNVIYTPAGSRNSTRTSQPVREEAVELLPKTTQQATTSRAAEPVVVIQQAQTSLLAPQSSNEHLDSHSAKIKFLENGNHTQPNTELDTVDGPNSNQPVHPFFEFLREVSQEISDEELEKMKFILQMSIGKADRDRMTQPYQLFEKMQQLGYLKPTDTTMLIDVLTKINRFDLIDKIVDFCKSNLNSSVMSV